MHSAPFTHIYHYTPFTHIYITILLPGKTLSGQELTCITHISRMNVKEKCDIAWIWLLFLVWNGAILAQFFMKRPLWSVAIWAQGHRWMISNHIILIFQSHYQWSSAKLSANFLLERSLTQLYHARIMIWRCHQGFHTQFSYEHILGYVIRHSVGFGKVQSMGTFPTIHMINMSLWISKCILRIFVKFTQKARINFKMTYMSISIWVYKNNNLSNKSF